MKKNCPMREYQLGQNHKNYRQYIGVGLIVGYPRASTSWYIRRHSPRISVPPPLMNPNFDSAMFDSRAFGHAFVNAVITSAQNAALEHFFDEKNCMNGVDYTGDSPAYS